MGNEVGGGGGGGSAGPRLPIRDAKTYLEDQYGIECELEGVSPVVFRDLAEQYELLAEKYPEIHQYTKGFYTTTDPTSAMVTKVTVGPEGIPEIRFYVNPLKMRTAPAAQMYIAGMQPRVIPEKLRSKYNNRKYAFFPLDEQLPDSMRSKADLMSREFGKATHDVLYLADKDKSFQRDLKKLHSKTKDKYMPGYYARMTSKEMRMDRYGNPKVTYRSYDTKVDDSYKGMKFRKAKKNNLYSPYGEGVAPGYVC